MHTLVFFLTHIMIPSLESKMMVLPAQLPDFMEVSVEFANFHTKFHDIFTKQYSGLWAWKLLTIVFTISVWGMIELSSTMGSRNYGKKNNGIHNFWKSHDEFHAYPTTIAMLSHDEFHTYPTTNSILSMLSHPWFHAFWWALPIANTMRFLPLLY